MATPKIPRRSVAVQIAAILDTPEVSALIADIDALRWTGRKGYGARSLIGACLVKSLYAIPYWTRTASLIAEHSVLATALGGTPSNWACYRFATKLRRESAPLDACLDALIGRLHAENPDYGRDIAIDGSDLIAYANGQRYVCKGGPERERYSDPDASWGHRSAVSTRKGGGFYGYKLHAAVCTRTGLPVAWEVHTAKTAELHAVPSLLDKVRARGVQPETCAMDKGYDYAPVHDACRERHVLPIIARRKFAGEQPPAPPTCEHGSMEYAGTDLVRYATRWCCTAGSCDPVWVDGDRRNPVVPRSTELFGALYRGRSAVEREFGRLKNEYGLAPLRVRRQERVRLHVDLVMLARLARADQAKAKSSSIAIEP